MSTPTPLKDYFHDYFIRSQSDHTRLFVSASFTGCAIGENYTHEAILVNSNVPYRSAIMYLEIPLPLWDAAKLNEKTGVVDYIDWQSNLDIPALTGHHPTSLPGHIFSAPLAVYGQLTTRSPDLIYPFPDPPDLPTFRFCPTSTATHLFVKAPWHLPDLDCYEKFDLQPLSSRGPIYTGNAPKKPTKKIEPFAVSEAFAEQVQRQFPTAHYWHAVNTVVPYGVDYWILPLLQDGPAP